MRIDQRMGSLTRSTLIKTAKDCGAARLLGRQFVAARGDYDLAPWGRLYDFKTWAEAEPRKGALFNYPLRHPDQIVSVACAPAPKRIASQAYVQATMTRMD